MVVTDVKRDRIVSASTWLLAISVFVAASVCSMWLWWVWGPTNPPYVAVNVEKHHAVQTDGGVLLYREFEITRPVEINITRELVRRDNQASGEQTVFRYAMPPSNAVYDKPGLYKLSRLIALPDGLPSGTYEVHNLVRYKANPIRESTFMLPIVTVKID